MKKTYVFFIICVIFSVYQSYLYGKFTAEKSWQDKLLLYQHTVKKLQNEVSNMDNYALCIELGGMPTQCAEFMPNPPKAAAHQRSSSSAEKGKSASPACDISEQARGKT